MSHEKPSSGLTRRNFLKTTAALAGTAALTGSVGCSIDSAVVSKKSTEESFSSCCIANCNGGCHLEVKVRDGKVVQTKMAPFPDPEYNRICMRGMSHLQRIYGPHRLKYPLKRVGERGAGEWERISWEDAVKEIVSTWNRLKDKYGPSTNLVSAGAIRYGSVFPVVLTGVLEGSNAMGCDDAAVMYTLPLAIGTSPMAAGNEPKDVQNSKTIVLWGANQANSGIQQCHFIFDAQDRGAKLITINPNFTSISAKADWFIPIRQGTDAALAMALAKYIIDQGWADIEFLTTQSVAPLLVKKSDGKYLRASEIGLEVPDENTGENSGNANEADKKNDPLVVIDESETPYILNAIDNPVIHGSYTIKGIEVTTAYDLLIQAISKYTLEKAEEICGIPEQDIIRLAEIFAIDEPLSTTALPGMDHYYNGWTPYFAIPMLMMVTGHLGAPGEGYGFGGYNAGWNINYAALAIPPYKTASEQVPLVCLNDIMETGEFKGKPLNIKSFLIWGKNIIGGQGDRQRLIDSFNKMEMVVSVDLEMTDTCQYADIVLPMAHFFEAEDVCSNGTPHLYNIYMEKAIEPLFECLHDFDAVMLLLKELGVDPGFTKEEFYRNMYDSKLNKAAGTTLDTLREKKVLKGVPSFMEDKNGNIVLGAGGIYNTDTGRAQFYLEDPKPRCDIGVPFDPDSVRLPAWEEPSEVSASSKLAEKYPLTLMTTHDKWRAHSAFARCEWLKELDPEPSVYINPKEAKNRGIINHDLVRVFNDRGYVVVKARYDDGMPSGLVNIPHGWRRDQFIEGHYNNLTHTITHPFTVHNCFFDVRVQVEKYTD